MKVTTDASLFGAWVAHQLPFSKKILDIGGGTGLLSLMLAQKNETEIDVVEIEETCFNQMKQNIEQSEWSDRIHCMLHDIKTFHPSYNYDSIISNPPFHQGQLTSTNPNINLARHGDDLTLEILFNKSMDLLKNDGKFYLLGPAYRDHETLSLAKIHGMDCLKKAIVKQSVHHDPFRCMYAFSKSKHSEIETEEIVIKDNKDQYTPEFIELLKDYYLFL